MAAWYAPTAYKSTCKSPFSCSTTRLEGRVFMSADCATGRPRGGLKVEARRPGQTSGGHRFAAIATARRPPRIAGRHRYERLAVSLRRPTLPLMARETV